MQDTSVSGMCFASDSGASLTTGRTLRGVPPRSLTEDELISFWADDYIPAPRTGSG